ncbi:MAG: glutamate 5-kinase [Phototrophicaceae bacterium]|jgi:glutamate 5-kinase
MALQRIVLKLGTSVLSNETKRLHRQRMLEIVQQVATLRSDGHELIVVSSGAQLAGRETLNYPEFSKTIPAKQVLSAVGQSKLMQIYGELFSIFEIVVAQVLLTRDDFGDRQRYLSARDALLGMVEHRLVPIINENDTIATHEIKVGDNDNLSALVANLIDADLLVILTDQPGLYTADPRRDPHAELIRNVAHITDSTRAIAGGAGTAFGTGGMATKIEAAQLASRSGIATVITAGREPNVLVRLMGGELLGTRFEPISTAVESRKRWLLAEKPRGELHIDAGATKALLTGGVSLLPVGIKQVMGVFTHGEHLAVVDPDGRRVAHGLANYSSDALEQLRGIKSDRISEILGYTNGDAAIHRNNLVLLL